MAAPTGLRGQLLAHTPAGRSAMVAAPAPRTGLRAELAAHNMPHAGYATQKMANAARAAASNSHIAQLQAQAAGKPAAPGLSPLAIRNRQAFPKHGADGRLLKPSGNRPAARAGSSPMPAKPETGPVPGTKPAAKVKGPAVSPMAAPATHKWPEGTMSEEAARPAPEPAVKPIGDKLNKIDAATKQVLKVPSPARLAARTAAPVAKAVGRRVASRVTSMPKINTGAPAPVLTAPKIRYAAGEPDTNDYANFMKRPAGAPKAAAGKVIKKASSEASPGAFAKAFAKKSNYAKRESVTGAPKPLGKKPRPDSPKTRYDTMTKGKKCAGPAKYGLLGGAVGAGIGAATGGPVGAAIGGGLGGAMGGQEQNAVREVSKGQFKAVKGFKGKKK